MSVTMQMPGLLDILLAKTDTPRPDCLIWAGATDRGYGRVYVDGQARRSHRVVWELKHGSIPEGLTVDHTCRIRACLNTDHMELVTGPENTRRAAPYRPEKRPLALYAKASAVTHCPNGHPYPEDAPPVGRGRKRCRTCQDQRNKRRARGVRAAE